MSLRVLKVFWGLLFLALAGLLTWCYLTYEEEENSDFSLIVEDDFLNSEEFSEEEDFPSEEEVLEVVDGGAPAVDSESAVDGVDSKTASEAVSIDGELPSIPPENKQTSGEDERKALPLPEAKPLSDEVPVATVTVPGKKTAI